MAALFIAALAAAPSLDTLLHEAAALDARPPCSVSVDYDIDAGEEEGERGRARFNREEVSWTELNPEEDEEGSDRPPPEDRYTPVMQLLSIEPSSVETDGALTTYTYTEVPEGTYVMGDMDMSKRVNATVTVEDTEHGPRVDSYRMAIKKPFRMKMVAKVHDLGRYVVFTEEDGYGPVAIKVEETFEFAAFGNRQAATVTMQYSDYDCPALEAAG